MTPHRGVSLFFGVLEAPAREDQFDSGGFLAKKQQHPVDGCHCYLEAPFRNRSVRFRWLLSQKTTTPHRGVSLFFGGTIQNRTGDGDFADRCLTAWLWCLLLTWLRSVLCIAMLFGAGNGARTRHLRLGKAALYQMSYSRGWCLRVESNHRHRDFQSLALPTELPRQMAIRRGLEPLTSSVTGWHSNQLNYRTTNGGNNRARTCDPLLVRQVLSQLSYAPERRIKSFLFKRLCYYNAAAADCQALFLCDRIYSEAGREVGSNSAALIQLNRQFSLYQITVEICLRMMYNGRVNGIGLSL